MRCLHYALVGLLALAALIVGSAGAYPGVTARVSVDNAGTQSDDDSTEPTISADGRFVAFSSSASNLVAGDTNGSADIFVHDRQTGTTEWVSMDSAGNQGNDHSSWPAVSADGRYVAFMSWASNLVSADTNGNADIFVHDRQTGTTERVSVASDGTETTCAVPIVGFRCSEFPSISADGRYVAFNSSASNLVVGDTNVCGSPPFDFNCYDIFVHDRQTGVTERVSVDSAGEQANTGSIFSSISADGRYVAFMSSASNLVVGDTNVCGSPPFEFNCTDIFVHDRQTGVTERVNVDSAGNQANGESDWRPTISDDGRYVAFQSEAGNLVASDTNGALDVFVHDRQTGVTERVSVDSDGNEATGGSFLPAISGDGQFIAFVSNATNLVASDTNGVLDIFVHDRQTGVTERVSVDSAADQANAGSDWPIISVHGRDVSFASEADNLVPDDTNEFGDVFVHTLADTDGDGEWDPFDNCPAWPNPLQDLPPWNIPADDPDCDGFTDTEEAFVGTDPADPCPDDLNDDAWPADLAASGGFGQHDETVNILDIVQLTPPAFGSNTGDPDYSARKDFNGDGAINILDIVRLTPPMFGESCT